MYISLINFVVNTCLFAIVLFLKNRLPKIRHIKILEEQTVKSASFILSVSVIVAGVAWYLPEYVWLNIVASLLSLTGVSAFFNTIHRWLKNTQHKKIRHEDLMAVGIWSMWLLSGAIFLANILVALMY